MPVIDLKNKGKRETKNFHFEVKSVATEERNGQKVGIITGLASTYDKDRGNDIILPGAFTETIARHKATGRPVRMLFQHWSENLIGGFPIESVKETAEGLEVVGEVNLLPGHMGEWAYSLAKQGVLSDFSIGFSCVEEEYQGNVRLIKKLELWEVSLVNEPMNTNARVSSVKSNGEQAQYTLDDVVEIKTLREFEKCLRDSGCFSKQAALHLAQLAKSNQWDAEADTLQPTYGVDFYQKASAELKPN
mgnify:CR=1 FL=1